MRYSTGFRASVVRKVLEGEGKSISEVAREFGVGIGTLQSWIVKSKDGRLANDGSDGIPPSHRNPAEKLALIIESKTLQDDTKGEWLRKNGLHSEHLPLWEQELTTILNDKHADKIDEAAELRKENKRLKKELEKKEKALAEAAVLLTLKKKYHTLFKEDGES